MEGFDPKACVLAALCAQSAEFKRYVRARVHPADVDDLLQIAALRAVESAGSLRDPARVVPWLYRIHRSVVVDAARKQSSERRMMAAIAIEVEPTAVEVAPGCACSVAQAQELGPNYASILNLVDIGGVPLSEAARALDISVNNATVRLHRARAALKKRMLEHCGVTNLRACTDCRCSYDGCCPA